MGLPDSFFHKFKNFPKIVHFYHNTCAIVTCLRSQMILKFVLSSFSLILRKEYSKYLSEMKETTFAEIYHNYMNSNLDKHVQNRMRDGN